MCERFLDTTSFRRSRTRRGRSAGRLPDRPQTPRGWPLATAPQRCARPMPTKFISGRVGLAPTAFANSVAARLVFDKYQNVLISSPSALGEAAD